MSSVSQQGSPKKERKRPVLELASLSAARSPRRSTSLTSTQAQNNNTVTSSLHQEADEGSSVRAKAIGNSRMLHDDDDMDISDSEASAPFSPDAAAFRQSSQSPTRLVSNDLASQSQPVVNRNVRSSGGDDDMSISSDSSDDAVYCSPSRVGRTSVRNDDTDNGGVATDLVDPDTATSADDRGRKRTREDMTNEEGFPVQADEQESSGLHEDDDASPDLSRFPDHDPEFKELLEKIDGDIVRHEEKALMERLDHSISTDEEGNKPGGRVEYEARSSNGTFVEEHRQSPTDYARMDMVPEARMPSSDENEVSHKIVLPKFVGRSRRRLLTASMVDKVLATERDYTASQRVAVRLDDKPGAPRSVVLHCQGHAELVKRIETRVLEWMCAEQQRIAGELQCDNPPDSLVDSDLEDNEPTRDERQVIDKKVRKKQSQRSGYNEFLDTYKGVTDIEFAGIRKSHVNSCTWKRHKDLFGGSCGDKCKCPRKLQSLTETVVSSYFEKEKSKDPSWNNTSGIRDAEYPVGFVGHFAQKFFPKLETEFPHESPKQILSRLLLMWDEHRKEQRFGITCSETCPCCEGWEFVFKKGHLLDGETEDASKRFASASGVARIPRRSSTATTGSTLSSLTKPKPYELVFRPGDILPCYFVTDETGDDKVCKIALLSPSAGSKDTRLQVGTIVTDAGIEGESTLRPVQTHSTLKKLYEYASKRQDSLRVRFINTASSLIGNMSSASQSDYGRWSSSGDWRESKRSLRRGWPGGARCVTATEAGGANSKSKSRDKRRQKATTKADSKEPAKKHPSMEENAAGLSVDENDPTVAHDQQKQPTNGPVSLCYSTSMATAKHRRAKPKASILKTNKPRDSTSSSLATSDEPGSSIQRYVHRPMSQRKVNFAEGFEKRFYDPQMESYKMATEVTEQPQVGGDSKKKPRIKTEPQKAPSTNELGDAVQHKGLDDVIALLQAGAFPNAADDNHKTPKDYVRSGIRRVKTQLAENPTNQELLTRARDFELKRKVLSIYIEALATIDRARFNKKWERLEYRVANVKGVRLTVGGEDHVGSNVLDCRVSVNDEAMRPLPLIPIDDAMEEWDNQLGFDNAANYNSSIMSDWPRERQEITISLWKGDKENDVNKPILLGEVVVPFSRIMAEAVAGSAVIEEGLSRNEFLESGVISIQARKAHDRAVRENKLKEVAVKLGELIQWIVHFNAEKKQDGTKVPSLSANIVIPNTGISLLHAAIYLDEPELVRKLLNLGADPAAPSDVGSARMLAMNLLGDRQDDEKSKEILRLLTTTGAGSADEQQTKPSALEDAPDRSKRSRDDAFSGDSLAEGEQRTGKRKRRSGRTKEALYNRLMDSNLSTLHQQIRGEGLKKADWTVRNKNGLFTASFISRGKGNRDRKKYWSAERSGGKDCDGEWWHKDEKSAKVSAFFFFVEKCIEDGLVNGDCTKTRDGKKLTGRHAPWKSGKASRKKRSKRLNPTGP